MDRQGREIWITGTGLVTPLGAGAEANWRGICEGRSGVARQEDAADPSPPEHFRYQGRVSGYEEPPEFPPKLVSQRKFLNRGSILGLHAAKEAIEGAGMDLSTVPLERRALYIGSGDFTRLGHLDFYSAVQATAGAAWSMPEGERLNETALHQVNPFFLLEGLANNLFSFLSACYDMMGPNGSISSLSACGAQALEHCERVLRLGEADVGLVVGSSCWAHPLVLFELDGLGMLSRAAEGAVSFRPFDRSRDGFFPGEGATALLLEPAEVARARGAKPLGRILGTGNGQELSPQRYMSVPDGAVTNAVREALREAGLGVDDLAFLLPHGSGTKRGDHGELSALRSIFEAAGTAPPLAGWKPYTGHMGAASDLAELVAGLRALNEGNLPGTPGFRRAEEGFESLPISAGSQPVHGTAFLSLSHGLGGQSSAVVIGAP